MSGTTIDLMLTAGWKGKLTFTSSILMSPAACASDHLPIAMTIKLQNRQGVSAKKVFLPTPHRRNAIALKAADDIYRFHLPRIASKLRACGSKIAFDAHVAELQAVLRKPWMTKVKPKPQRNTEVWSATADRIAKWRSKVVRRALSSEGKASDRIKKRRLDHEIKRLVREKTHLRRQVAVDNLRKDTSSLFLDDVAARINKIHAATDDASRMGEELIPRDITVFFANKPAQTLLVELRKYPLPAEMKKIYRQAIRRGKKGKAAEPDGVPMELLQISPAAFAETLFELFSAGARLKCVMKDWDVSTLIPIFKKKGLIAVPANNRPLRLILIIRKTFEMGTAVR